MADTGRTETPAPSGHSGTTATTSSHLHPEWSSRTNATRRRTPGSRKRASRSSRSRVRSSAAAEVVDTAW